MNLKVRPQISQDSSAFKDILGQSEDISIFQLFEDIENTSGRNAKLALLEQADGKQKILLLLALDPYRQFHVTKWNEFYRPTTAFKDDEQAYNSFIELVAYCSANNHSTELVNRVSSFMENCTDIHRKWFGRVLTKDLRFGVLAKSVNKVYPKLIPEFDVMLAQKAENDLSNVDFSRDNIVERKYDGFRIGAFFRESEGSEVILDVIGRSGKPVVNKEFVDRQRAIAQELKGYIIDGEGYDHSLKFEEISSILRTEDKPLTPNFRFYVFDVLTEEEWRLKTSVPLKERILRRIILGNKYPDVFVAIDNWLVSTPAQVLELYNQFIEEGYEGAMIKDLDALYEWKRSKYMLKVKPEDFVDVTITGYYEGQGKYVGQLGGFVCVDEEGNEVRAGGGYKDWQRVEFWENKDLMLGKIIEVKFTMKTGKDKFRHPNFRRVREDK